MPPRRYIALASPLILLVCLLTLQQYSLTPPGALAQSVDVRPDTAEYDPNDLVITLVATSDSPLDHPKKIGEVVTFTATVTAGNGNGLTFF